jgi:hypothetical protein
MPRNLLKNGGFEADWGEEKSHRCLVYPKRAEPHEDVGNIFVPPGWDFWFRHDPGRWDQPEGRDAWKVNAPERVRSGEKGFMWFTFSRNHDAGLLQRVNVAPGTRLRVTAWLHAWSNGLSARDGGHRDDGRWSDGAGYEQVAWEAGTQPHDTGDKQQDAKANFTFQVGIDPTGDTDPLADTVVWGKGYHIYNGYVKQLEVEATAESDSVTVFIRSKTLWAFKHNDAYVDDAELAVVGEEEPPPEVRLTHQPPSPEVGEAATIEARSLAGLTDVNLVVTQPSGAELARGSVVVGRDGDWHTWTYTTSSLSEVGTHTVAFSAAGGVEAAAAFEVVPEIQLSHHPASPKVSEAVTIVARSLAVLTDVNLAITQPSGAELARGSVVVGLDAGWHTWTYTTSPLSEVGTHAVVFSAADDVEVTDAFDCAAATPPVVQPKRGLPRTQYKRTYVLLPPGTDTSWALAAIDGAWSHFNYTVGGSADDAGIGDLDSRRVIAVNPGEWSDDLRAFFERYYSGVAYVAVEASTPDELRRKLKRL